MCIVPRIGSRLGNTKIFFRNEDIELLLIFTLILKKAYALQIVFPFPLS